MLRSPGNVPIYILDEPLRLFYDARPLRQDPTRLMEVIVFGSTILEVIIGMLFVYLLLSLLCSAIGEYLEAKWNNRAKLLKKGIELLLNDTTGPSTTDLAKQLYAHGLIRPLYRDEKMLPSYIPSRTFALALWNMATAAMQRRRDH